MASKNEALPEELTVAIPSVYVPKIVATDTGQEHYRRVGIVLIEGVHCLKIKTWWGIQVALEMGINLSKFAPKLNEFDIHGDRTYLVNKAFMSGH